MRRMLAAAAAALALAGASVAVAGPANARTTADADVRSTLVVMTGRAERPGPGDPDGFGFALVSLTPAEGEICYVLTASRIEPATAAHIHRGGREVAGPVVVPLEPPTSGLSAACVTADRGLVTEIAADPEGYYVNVHNAPYPAGAIRAQLR
ncbi:CHRD domain-containing protein [Georgenia sp. AZ-5]|uniref:CHRD domain-containing protein n=1 Tax=Georgenia sp. AZ-5 TaxID=3367526 RepID=UPI0037548E5F